ncbi:MAG: bacteriohemerythrin [Acidobacteria bacterium]|nr:bacteriohemerythrin [Acidobacteriota bacterium]
MALLEWKSEYEMNIRDIDAQHRQLIAITNELHEAMRQGRGGASLGAVMDKLVSYTKHHFGEEERLLAMHGYPAYAAHKDEHAKLTAQVGRLAQEAAAGRLGLSVEVAGLLGGWLTNHILGTDRLYAAHLVGRGVH